MQGCPYTRRSLHCGGAEGAYAERRTTGGTRRSPQMKQESVDPVVVLTASPSLRHWPSRRQAHSSTTSRSSPRRARGSGFLFNPAAAMQAPPLPTAGRRRPRRASGAASWAWSALPPLQEPRGPAHAAAPAHGPSAWRPGRSRPARGRAGAADAAAGGPGHGRGRHRAAQAGPGAAPGARAAGGGAPRRPARARRGGRRRRRTRRRCRCATHKEGSGTVMGACVCWCGHGTSSTRMAASTQVGGPGYGKTGCFVCAKMAEASKPCITRCAMP